MHRLKAPTTLASLAVLALAATSPTQVPARVLDGGLHHLGDSNLPAWNDVPAEPEGTRLDLEFKAQRNAREHLLSLRYHNVDDNWDLRLNGVLLGRLTRDKAMRTYHYTVPAGALVDGRNTLSLFPDKTTDDIVVGDIRLHEGTLREVLQLQPVTVRVQDRDGTPLPAKVTITDAAGDPAEHYYGARLHTAVRKGICYTADGAARFELPPGEYVVYATRGPEWGLARATVRVEAAPAGSAPVDGLTLSITREVDTTGFVASDTHIHTYTHSGHGDSSVEERMVTLAGEGVELAIATDHNHHTDYRPTQEAMKMHAHFTPVTGNEVTTRVGHFNAFPFDPQASIPNHKLEDWILLVDDIRAKGAEVVILNHPRWPQIPTGPFGVYHLNRVSGELPGRKAIPFDAMELVNTTQMLTNPLYLFTDWFALLNHGERVTAVGTSDSHTVGDPVGQGRTYVRSSTDDPARIDVDEACRAFREGDTTISVGIFCDLVVEKRYRMGHTIPATDRRVSLALRVAAASWIRPRVAKVFVNGALAAESDVPTHAGTPTDVHLPFTVALPPHDAWLVCVVLGEGVNKEYWRTQKPYSLAATNPVYLDVDGDGSYTSPRVLAASIVEKHGTEPARLRPALSDFDDAVAVEALSLARAAYEGGSVVLAELQRARAKLVELTGGETPAREVFTRYLESLPSPEKVVERATAKSK